MNLGFQSNKNLRTESKAGSMTKPRKARPTVRAPEFDYFFKTIQSRGFANKMTPEMV